MSLAPIDIAEREAARQAASLAALADTHGTLAGGVMAFRRALLVVLASLACAACQAPVTPQVRPDPSRYDTWTTPPPGEDAPRFTRAAAAAATSAASRWSADAEINVLNVYAWRGLLVSDGPVLQPAANVSYGELRFNVWANLDLDDVNGNAGQVNEVDLTLEWLHAFDEAPVPLRVFAGAIVYLFPNTAFPTTTEVYGGLSLAVPANPTLTVYRDVDEIDGTYATFHVQDSLKLGEGLHLDGRLALGWGDGDYDRGYFGVADGGVNDLQAVLALRWTLGRWTVKPFASWYTLLDADLRAATASSDIWVYGLSVGANL